MRLVRFFLGAFSISLKRELAYRANLLFQVFIVLDQHAFNARGAFQQATGREQMLIKKAAVRRLDPIQLARVQNFKAATCWASVTTFETTPACAAGLAVGVAWAWAAVLTRTERITNSERTVRILSLRCMILFLLLTNRSKNNRSHQVRVPM